MDSRSGEVVRTQRPQGRMLRVSVSGSQKLARLSPKALSLFLILTPHFNAFGKMNGDPMYVKAEVVPLIPWFTVSIIRKCLTEIDKETSTKWFKVGGRWFLHNLSWDDHQDVKAFKRGKTDHLPSHPDYIFPENSETTPGVIQENSNIEVEVKEEVEKEEEVEVEVAANGLSVPIDTGPAVTTENIEKTAELMRKMGIKNPDFYLKSSVK